MKKSPNDQCVRARAQSENDGVRLSFYFCGEGDNHHSIFLDGETRVQVADRLRELAKLVMDGAW